MPSDPVYNPQLPASSVWNPSSSALGSTTPASSQMSLSDESRSSRSALSVGLIAGAVTGAALALLLTPARGSEIRRSIQRYASDRGGRLSSMLRTRPSVGSPSEPAAWSSRPTHSGSEPLTATVAEISAIDRRFEEPLGG